GWHPGRNNVPRDSLRHGQREHRKTRYRRDRDKHYCGDKKRKNQGCYRPTDGKENQRRCAKEMGWPCRRTHRRRSDPHAAHAQYMMESRTSLEDAKAATMKILALCRSIVWACCDRYDS